MAPQTVVFGELPKTSTGKTQKFLLREKTKRWGVWRREGRANYKACVIKCAVQ
ncbi:hypothetical protein HanPSC8_Chr16g0695661 [Helianthus annuus]|nr:hypothetical protein HanIR_Chr16g0789271 [Helianthus annuus]KAJ0819401.1 hypothetical protein HanPSC8_Chr16g0695661 [Helianthus annuus]